MLDIERICVAEDVSLRKVTELLDESGRQIIMIVDQDRRLKGTFTDGDLRRALLKGATLSDSVRGFFNGRPIASPANGGRSKAVAIMRERGIDQIPLVDDEGRIVGVESINPVRVGIKIDYPVVIMAGGRGKRLHPITESIPKALVSVGDKPILEHILERFAAQGFQRFTFAVNHMSEMIEDYFGDGSRWNVSVDYVRENARLGTAGALSLLENRPTTPFIVTNCDVLTTTSFQDVLESHMASGAMATIGVREFSYRVPFGVMEVAGSQLRRIAEKPEHTWLINAGIYVLDPAVIDIVPKDTFFDMTDVMNALIARDTRVSTYMIRRYWIDIGMPQDLDQARQEIHGVT
jgi:dTDP-glucose pyrophosphorylase